jgi:hypothetical protein
MAESRKLAAILAADVAGYSRLAGADEEGTLARLRALRSHLEPGTYPMVLEAIGEYGQPQSGRLALEVTSNQPASALTRLVRREIFREAALLWMTPR